MLTGVNEFWLAEEKVYGTQSSAIDHELAGKE